MSLTRIELPNGLKVLLAPSKTAAVVAMQAWVSVGSADEPPELAGIAHVFEHMLFKGTARRGVGQIAQEVEGAGGEINAWTSFDQTVYHLVMASRFFSTGLDILADAIQHSSFDADELQKELKVVLEEVRQGEDSPGRVAAQTLFSTAFTRHPYRRPVIGYSRTVEKFKRERLLEFFRRHYVARNITLVMVGDFELADAKQKIAKLFGKMPSGSASLAKGRPKSLIEPPQRTLRAKVLAEDVSEAHLSLAFHIPALRHPDTAPLDVASVLLGQGDSSRLTREIRRKRELCSDVYAYSYTPRDPGLFVAGATLPMKDLTRGLGAICEELFRLTREDVTSEELTKSKAILESDLVYQKETVQGQARKLGFFEQVAGGVDYENEYNRQVAEVTPSQIREVVSRYFQPHLASVVAVVPNAEKARLKGLEAKLAQAVKQAALAPVKNVRHSKKSEAGSEVVAVTLPSGGKLLIMPETSVALLAMRAVWTGGLRNEDERSNGINNLLAGLVTRGTKSHPGDGVVNEVEAMAGAMGGFSGKNSFGLRAELLGKHWERGLELMADCMLNPEFVEPELEKERRQVLEEIRTQADNVSSEAFRLFHRTLYPTHPYRLDLSGSKESVTRLKRQDLLSYFQRNAAPSQMTLALVGDVDPDAVVKKAELLFPASLRAGKLAALKPPVLDAPPSKVIELTRFKNKQQAHIVYGFSGTTVADPDRFPLEVLSTILSGQGGRLFLELRDKKGLAYRVSAFSVEGVDPGYFAVYIATSPENIDVAIAGIKEELHKVCSQNIPRDELERSKRYLVGAHEISLQRRAALASSLSFHHCYGMGWDEYRRYAPGIMSISSADVRRVAEKYLRPERSILAVIRPELSASASAPRAKGIAKAALR